MISDLPANPLSLEAPDPRALVCVVDDEETVRHYLERLLRSAGFPVETYASATDYLDRKAHSGPICLILDVNMPELDGFHLQKTLAGRCEQIVFITGHGDVPMCARAMKAGAVDFLTKPVDDEILLAAVSQRNRCHACPRNQPTAHRHFRQCPSRSVIFPQIVKVETKVR